jgi:hypothetical protein
MNDRGEAWTLWKKEKKKLRTNDGATLTQGEEAVKKYLTKGKPKSNTPGA